METKFDDEKKHSINLFLVIEKIHVQCREIKQREVVIERTKSI